MLIPKAIRRRFAPARSGFDEPPQRFAGRLTLDNIYGEWWASARDGFFIRRWCRFFAYLHQFDNACPAAVLATCAAGEECRDFPNARPNRILKDA